jgi:hypothetical protein
MATLNALFNNQGPREWFRTQVMTIKEQTISNI